MDLSLKLRGRLILDDSGWSLFQPIVFEDIKSGPDGFVTIYVDSLRIGDRSIPVNSSPKIYTSTAGNRNPACERRIEKPVPFQDTGDGDNRLALLIEPSEHQPTTTVLPTENAAPISIRICIVFLGGHVITFNLAGELATNGTATLDLVAERTHQPMLALANFVLLTSSLGLLLFWDTRINQDIYLQSSHKLQEYSLLLLGGYLAFFGLTATKIKGWIQSLTRVRSFMRFPELYLGRQLFRNFSSPLCSVVLAVGVVATSILIVNLRSVPYDALVPASQPDGFAVELFDTLEGKSVPTGQRVYRAHVRENEGRRFRYVCKPTRPQPRCSTAEPVRETDRPRYLGSPRFDGGDPLSTATVTVLLQDQTDQPPLEPRTADLWLETPSASPIGDRGFLVRHLLCGQEWVPRDHEGVDLPTHQSCRWHSGEAIEVRVDTHREHYDISISPLKWFAADELVAFFHRHKDAMFTNSDRDAIFHQRGSRADAFKRRLLDHFGSNGTTDAPSVVSAIERLLDDAHFKRRSSVEGLSKALIERFAYFRAVLDVLERSTGRALSDDDLDRLCATLRPYVTERAIDWKIIRVTTEAALEASLVMTHGQMQERMHELVATQWRNEDPRRWRAKRREKVRWRVEDYLSTILYLNAAEGPYNRFLRRTIPVLYANLSARDTAESLIYREVGGRDCQDEQTMAGCKSNRGDFSLDWSNLQNRMTAMLANLDAHDDA